MASGVNSSDPPTRARMRSISTVYARSGAMTVAMFSNPAVAIFARSEVEPIRYLLPAADGRAEWIGQGDVVASGPQGLVDLGIAPGDLEPCATVLGHR
jgi:hypothetical protein